MNINVTNEENGVTLAIEGRLDALTMEQFGQTVEPYLTGECKDLTMDFQGVEYISSGGLRIIMNAVRKLQQSGGKLQIVKAQPNVYSLLELTGFNNFISITAAEKY